MEPASSRHQEPSVAGVVHIQTRDSAAVTDTDTDAVLWTVRALVTVRRHVTAR